MQFFYCKDESLVEPRKKRSAKLCILQPFKKVTITQPYRNETSTLFLTITKLFFFIIPIILSLLFRKIVIDKIKPKLTLTFSCNMTVSRMTLNDTAVMGGCGKK